MGNLKGGFVYREILRADERGLRKRNISLYGSSVRGTRKGGLLYKDLEGYVQEGSGKGRLSLQGS